MQVNKMARRLSAAVLAPVAIGLVGAVAPATAACVPGTRLCVVSSGDPAPAPSPVQRIVGEAIGTVGPMVPGGGDVCQPTLGGVVVVPPLPAPTPGVRPQDTIAKAGAVCRDTVAAVEGRVVAAVDHASSTIGGIGGGDVCQPTLGGVVVVPPLPAPTPDVRPPVVVEQAEAICHELVGTGPVDHSSDTRIGR